MAETEAAVETEATQPTPELLQQGLLLRKLALRQRSRPKQRLRLAPKQRRKRKQRRKLKLKLKQRQLATPLPFKQLRSSKQGWRRKPASTTSCQRGKTLLT